jgi:hypothetical protein
VNRQLSQPCWIPGYPLPYFFGKQSGP